MHTAHCTLHVMRNCVKNKARREYDRMTAYTERTGQAAWHTENQDCSRNIFRIWKHLSPEERKQLVSRGRTGPHHTAAWLFPVVARPRSCRTLHGSWELALRNWLLLASRVSLAEACYLGMPAVR